MNFFSGLLSSLGSTLSQGASNIYNSVTSLPSTISNLFGGGTANAASSLGATDLINQNHQALNDAQARAIIDQGNQSGQYNQTLNTAALPRIAPNTYSVNGQPVVTNNLGQPQFGATQTVRSGSIGSTGYQPSPLSIAAANPRPLVQSGPQTAYTPSTDSYGRTSNAQVGNAYYDQSGNYVTPTQAFSGLSGSSSSPMFSSALTPTTGSSGLAGGSSYTGTLGATGLYASSPLAGTAQTEDDKARQKKLQDLFSSMGVKTDATGKPLLPGVGSNLGTSTQTANSTPMTGNLSPYFQQSNVTPQASSAPLQAPTVAPSTNVTTLTTPPNPALNTSHANSVNDVGDTNTAITNNFNSAKQTLDSKYPSDTPLTTDTPEQKQLMDSSADPYGVKAALDAYKSSNTNLVQLESARLDVMKNIQALNEAYNPIIQDIKNNPDLPKGLAARRLTDLNTKQKDVLLGFTNQLDLLNASISDQNEQVNRAFQIVQFSQNQAEKATDNSRQLLNSMVSTGAIGGMSDKELAQLAQTSGVPLDGLKKARQTANDPSKNIDVETDDNGTVRGIDKTSGKLVWTIAGAGKSSASANSASAGSVSGYTDSLVNQLLNRQSGVTFTSLSKDDKQLAIQAFGDRGLSIPRALTSQEKNAADQATSGLTALQQIQTMKQNGGLPLTADFYTPSSGILSSVGTYLNKDLSQYRTAANEVSDIITRMRTGAALNENEITFYQNKLPKLGDSDAAQTNKINQLQGFFLGMSGLPVTVTGTDGSSYVFQDLFDPQQRLGLRTAIDKGYTLNY